MIIVKSTMMMEGWVVSVTRSPRQERKRNPIRIFNLRQPCQGASQLDQYKWWAFVPAKYFLNVLPLYFDLVVNRNIKSSCWSSKMTIARPRDVDAL